MASVPHSVLKGSASNCRFVGNQIAPGRFLEPRTFFGSEYLMPYIAIVLAILLQTDRTAPAQGPTSLQKGYAEYSTGHFAAAEQLLLDALRQLPEGNAELRAEVL